MKPDYETLIVGAGFSGIGAAINLDKAGLGDYQIIEAGDGAGGTWYWNTYPGIAVDIPSFSYQFSFEKSPDWTRTYAPGRELRAYAEHCVDKYGLRPKIRFGTKVLGARFDDDDSLWRLELNSGAEITGRFLINASGVLITPNLPDIDGVDSFAGLTMHTAQWDHSVDLTGKRVAVVGTGASAIQIVPEIVDRVGQLQLYQRTPAWVLPRSNNAIPARLRTALATVPGTRALLRNGIYWFQEALGFAMTQRPELLTLGEMAGRWNIRRQVRDRSLRERLTPSYRLGCKRVLFSDNYFRAIDQPKSELVTDRIVRITPNGIVTADGGERPVDVIVFATGFHVTDSYTYVDIKGPGGEDLVDRWNTEGVQAHRGITVADVPNLFFLLGPNTGLGHNSVVFMIESQIRYVGQAIAAVDSAGAQALAPTRAAQDAFNAELQDKLAGSVWSTGGCSSWYLDEHGKNRTLWSGMTWQYWLTTRSLKAAEYRFSGVRKR